MSPSASRLLAEMRARKQRRSCGARPRRPPPCESSARRFMRYRGQGHEIAVAPAGARLHRRRSVEHQRPVRGRPIAGSTAGPISRRRDRDPKLGRRGERPSGRQPGRPPPPRRGERAESGRAAADLRPRGPLSSGTSTFIGGRILAPGRRASPARRSSPKDETSTVVSSALRRADRPVRLY